MLVITRKTSESFFIGDDVKITILEVAGEKIKIGIDAPKEIKIVRSEVYDTINNNRQAISASAPFKIELEKYKSQSNKN